MQFIGADTYCDAGNGTIPWDAVIARGITFAIIRASWGTGLVRGKVSQDKRFFDENWAAMRAAGIVRGAYLFLRLGDGTPPASHQVRAFADTVGALEHGDLPPCIDLEFDQAKTGWTHAQLLAGFTEAWNLLRDEYQAAPIIYTSARIWDDELGNPPAPPEMLESPLWLASYWKGTNQPAMMAPAGGRNPLVPMPWAGADARLIPWREKVYSTDNWAFHQYQGDALGLIPGNVDLNRMRSMGLGSRGERVRWLQRRLGVTVDGVFGPKTDAAVFGFQRANGLGSDGIVGPATFARLCWPRP